MAEATSRGPVFFTYAVVLHPQPSRRDAVITPPVIYLPGVIGNIVTYAGRDMRAARTKFCSKRSGAKRE